MSVKLSVKDLAFYLPHRPPMVWIDHIVEVGDDYKKMSGICKVHLNDQALYCSERGEILASAAIEFTAQAFGYIKAAYQVIHKFVDAPTQTYLTGVRSCKADFSEIKVPNHQILHVRVNVVREILPLTMVRGVVFIPETNEVIAETEIQVYVE